MDNYEIAKPVFSEAIHSYMMAYLYAQPRLNFTNDINVFIWNWINLLWVGEVPASQGFFKEKSFSVVFISITVYHVESFLYTGQ